MKQFEVEFSHNNSGGFDWVDEKDWVILVNNGWSPSCGDMPRPYTVMKVFEAASSFAAASMGTSEVEDLIGIDSTAEGCSCCGAPFSFWAYEVSDEVRDESV